MIWDAIPGPLIYTYDVLVEVYCRLGGEFVKIIGQKLYAEMRLTQSKLEEIMVAREEPVPGEGYVFETMTSKKRCS